MSETQGFGQDRDIVTRNILLNIQRDLDLVNAIATSRKAREITDNDLFWKDRIELRFPSMLQFKERLGITYRQYYAILSLVADFTLTEENPLLIYGENHEMERDRKPEYQQESTFQYRPTVKLETDRYPWDDEGESIEFRGRESDPWDYHQMLSLLSDDYHSHNRETAKALGKYLSRLISLNLNFFLSEFFLTKLFLRGRYCRATDAMWFAVSMLYFLREDEEVTETVLRRTDREEQTSGLFTDMDQLDDIAV